MTRLPGPPLDDCYLSTRLETAVMDVVPGPSIGLLAPNTKSPEALLWSNAAFIDDMERFGCPRPSTRAPRPGRGEDSRWLVPPATPRICSEEEAAAAPPASMGFDPANVPPPTCLIEVRDRVDSLRLCWGFSRAPGADLSRAMSANYRSARRILRTSSSPSACPLAPVAVYIGRNSGR